jgi:predicted dehydrogenase
LKTEQSRYKGNYKMNTRTTVGIIGAGLMGREIASALGRWFVLENFPVRPELTSVCDINEKQLEWFKQVPTVNLLTTNYYELLSDPGTDIVYVAVPHSLHEKIYLDVMQSGKDLLAEKPFGINLESAKRLLDGVRSSGRFVRCSSEFPFFPGAQRVVQAVQNGDLGRMIEIKAGFLHSSDIDPGKKINWKRQAESCGESGVMNDLGMHVLHVPLRLGWKPKSLFAVLQNIVTERPDGSGTMVPCDTWDNATLFTRLELGGMDIPMTLEMKRIAPGETNTWYIEITGTMSSVRFSTKEPKTLRTFRRDADQWWQKTDLGFQVPFKTITGSIFETGFPDIILQMLASFVAERGGFLNGRFGCVTPDEAVISHEIYSAALQSFKKNTACLL